MGRCRLEKKKALCHRSDYLPSFHHQFKENNHGFVSVSHARPLRPKNGGENQNQRESKTGTSGSSELHTPAADTNNRLVFLPVSAVIPAIVSRCLVIVYMDCFLSQATLRGENAARLLTASSGEIRKKAW